MKIEDIFNEWEKDAEIDITKIDRESISVAKLHHKYYKYLSIERASFYQQEANFKIIKKIKTEYYSGTLDTETMKERGYRHINLRILRSDVPSYIEADEELIQLSLKISIQKEKVEVLESIIKMIMNRGFHLKTHVDYIKFRDGAS